ncbi:phospholipid scramblase 1 [Lingula anatina]|uniref:Phospholipid scramblase n=1 Tax=Lingula anatina TaxID=7574 RepID=A0A1S3H3U1_LINAN|nr:phospholipid scramblase 1 [Lingula anatina]|eukprot:XP_013380673.1 phospholipid scramblase 1 [Lingula anatina]
MMNAQPMMMQPGMQPAPGGGVQWMPQPAVPQGCPPGLEYLSMIDQLLVHQQVEILEAFTDYETNNKYEIKNSMGQRVYFAAEDTCCCTRNCCGKERPFDIQIMTPQGHEVIHLSRPLRCDTCWFPCCLQKVTVEAPVGQVIGYVKQSWSVCVPKFAICNAEGDTVLRIEGPCVPCSACGDVIFDVKSADGEHQVGQVSKQWSGLVKELFTDADNFGVSFPMDLDVKMKACMLGAVFLIDFMFFEKEKNEENTQIGMM